jgi:Uma2 family endonuclease
METWPQPTRWRECLARSTVSDKVEPPAGLTYGEPVWDIARLYPNQGCWSEWEYFDLNTNQRVEFSHGYIEFLPMPTVLHQRIIRFLFQALNAIVTAGDLGEILFAGTRVRLWDGKFREPDVVFMTTEHRSRITKDYWDGADMVMEVVSDSPSDRHRDPVEKRGEYARAGIPEYWIVDPQEGQITVLTLEGDESAVHGTFARGERATSKLLPGFSVDVTAALAAGR